MTETPPATRPRPRLSGRGSLGKTRDNLNPRPQHSAIANHVLLAGLATALAAGTRRENFTIPPTSWSPSGQWPPRRAWANPVPHTGDSHAVEMAAHAPSEVARQNVPAGAAHQ